MGRRWRWCGGALVALGSAGLLVGSGVADAQPTAAAPPTIPALQEWQPAAGEFRFTAGTRVVATGAAVEEVAAVLADDLAALSGHRPAVVTEAAAGDVVLSVGDTGLPADGYSLTITPAAVSVVAETDTGVFLGTRTILQLLASSSTLPAGTARDWPRYPERGLMLDLGRQHLPPAWIEQHIREIAFLKMNVLHLHLSDNLGFRVASDSHPEIVSAEHLTKDEVRHLLAVADRYHVTVIPEIDMPGHMQQILASHPELRLVDAFGQPNPTALDVTKPEARQFAQEIIEEYLELFPGPFWHGGGDEFLHPLNQPFAPAELAYPTYPSLLRFAQARFGPTANHRDAFLDFVNWMDDLVRSHGRTLRVWADGLHGGGVVGVRPDVIAEWWQFNQFTASASELLARGHRIVNAGWFPTYYSVAFYGPLTGQLDHRLAWDEWEVEEFWGIEDVVTGGLTAPRVRVDRDEPANLGARVHVFFDEPGRESIEATTAAICPKLRLVAQKTWRSPDPSSWDDFLERAGTIGRAPGFAIDAPGACASPRSVALPPATAVRPSGAPAAAPAAAVAGGLPATGGDGLPHPVVLPVLAAGLLLRRSVVRAGGRRRSTA